MHERGKDEQKYRTKVQVFIFSDLLFITTSNKIK